MQGPWDLTLEKAGRQAVTQSTVFAVMPMVSEVGQGAKQNSRDRRQERQEAISLKPRNSKASWHAQGNNPLANLFKRQERHVGNFK